VERAYGRFLQSQARYEDVAGRAVRADDLALVDFRGECAGRPVAELAGEAAGLGEGRDFWVLAGEPEFLPGFSAGLLGAAVGEERSLRVCFPADYRVRELAGREADYKVRVKALRERKPPVVDAEFLKRCEADSEQALREKIRTQLQKEAARIEKERLRAQVVQYLLERTELDVPQSLVEEETSLTVREMVRRIAMEGGTREQILQQRESILNTATRSSTERVRISYILSRIADEERIQVEDRALDERIEALARQAGMPAQRLRAELEKRNGLEGLRSDLRAEQTLEFILEQARIRS
jgi:trigger factor